MALPTTATSRQCFTSDHHGHERNNCIVTEELYFLHNRETVFLRGPRRDVTRSTRSKVSRRQDKLIGGKLPVIVIVKWTELVSE
jgi:hypothetical protein